MIRSLSKQVLPEKLFILSVLILGGGCNNLYEIKTANGIMKVPLETALARAETMEDLSAIENQNTWRDWREDEKIKQRRRVIYARTEPGLSKCVRDCLLGERFCFCEGMTLYELKLANDIWPELRYSSSDGYEVYEDTLYLFVEYPKIRNYTFYFRHGKLTDWSYTPSGPSN